MQRIIIFTAIMAYAVAAPVVFLAQTYPAKSTFTKSHQIVDHGSTYHAFHPIAPLTGKTTVTKSSQLVNHGSTHVVHAVPVVHQHEPVNVHVHEPIHVHEQVHVAHEPVHLHHAKSSQYFHLETAHVPKVAVHTHEPLVHVHEPYVHVPVHSHRIGDSAVSHHSSTVHETVPYVKSIPVYGLH